MAWTTPATVVTGDVIQASWANTHVRDNSRYLKGLDGAVSIEDDVSVVDLTASGGVNAGGESGALAGEIKALVGRFAGFPGVSGGLATEIGIAASEGVVQAINRTLATYFPMNVQGSLVVFKVSGTEKGRVNSTGFSGDGSQLTGLNATQLTSGTVPDARISGKNISLFTNDTGYAVAPGGTVFGIEQSIANGGTYTICPSDEGGLFALRDDQGNFGLLYLFTGPLQSEVADPFNVFSFIAGTGSSWNLYITGGDITIQNNRGSTRTISIARLAGG